MLSMANAVCRSGPPYPTGTRELRAPETCHGHARVAFCYRLPTGVDSIAQVLFVRTRGSEIAEKWIY
jgi:hypothetical protein